jgi:hypothetical protein
MNISSAIQKHYHKQSVLLIPSSIDSIRHTFAKLSNVGIVRGNRWNLFAPYYKLEVRWDGNTANLDGPYGAKMLPLTTKITFQPSMSRDCTRLCLSMRLSIKYINISLAIISLLATLTLCLSSKSLEKSIVFLVGVIVCVYGISWLYFFYSSNLILKCLPKEFQSVDIV